MQTAIVNDRSPVFATFLTTLEANTRGISDRSYADQDKIAQMAKFVMELARWSIFGTFTFRWAASVDSARRVFERFVRRTVPDVSVFYAVELHPGGHGGHVHAIFDRYDFPRISMWREWHKRFGINRIEPVRGFTDVAEYCSKYVVKDHAWWNFSLSRSAWQRWKERSNQCGNELKDLLGKSCGGVQSAASSCASVALPSCVAGSSSI